MNGKLDAAGDAGAPGAVGYRLAEWGGWERVSERAAGLVDNPDLLRLVQDMCAEATRPDSAASAFAAVVEAVAACRSPALFGEVVELLLFDSEALPGVARQLSSACVQHAQPPVDADGQQWLLAAYALEGVVRLALGELTPQFAALALLVELPPVAPPAYSRAALRCLGAAFERWREPELVAVLDRMSGSIAAPGTDGRLVDAATADEWRRQIEPDAAYELGSAALLLALTAESVSDAEIHLVRAASRFRVAATAGRGDAGAYGDVVLLLRAHLPTADGRALWASTDLRLLGSRLQQAAREHIVGSVGLVHWRSPRLDAEFAWAELADDVVNAAEAVRQPSWYRVDRVLAQVLAAWTASRCSRVLSRRDQEGVQAIIGPVIESGIAVQTGLMRHLEDHVRELELRAPDGDTTDDDDVFEELAACRALLTATRAQIALPELRPKPEGSAVGAVSSDGLAALPLLGRLAGRDVEVLIGLPAEVALRMEAALARLHAMSEEPDSLVVEETFSELRERLSGSADYRRQQVQQAVDRLMRLLLRFWHALSGMSPSQMPWLYDPKAVEADLQDELFRFLQVSGLGHVSKREVPGIGGGRVDIVCAFDGFELVLEMKKDASVGTPVKGKYLLQAASYQAGGVTIGFLVVLELAPLPSAPHLRSCFDVAILDDPALGAPRYVITVLVPGNRTAPSSSTRAVGAYSVTPGR